LIEELKDISTVLHPQQDAVE